MFHNHQLIEHTLISCAFTLAPLLINNSTTSQCPLYAAMCNGVWFCPVIFISQSVESSNHCQEVQKWRKLIEFLPAIHCAQAYDPILDQYTQNDVTIQSTYIFILCIHIGSVFDQQLNCILMSLPCCNVPWCFVLSSYVQITISWVVESLPRSSKMKKTERVHAIKNWINKNYSNKNIQVQYYPVHSHWLRFWSTTQQYLYVPSLLQCAMASIPDKQHRRNKQSKMSRVRRAGLESVTQNIDDDIIITCNNPSNWHPHPNWSISWLVPNHPSWLLAKYLCFWVVLLWWKTKTCFSILFGFVFYDIGVSEDSGISRNNIRQPTKTSL